MPVKVRTLQQRHPGHRAETVRVHRALAVGGEAFEGVRETLIPKSAAEPVDLYAERIRRTTYTPDAGGIVSLLLAHLFSEPPRAEGLPAWGVSFLSDCDRQGTTWTAWWRDTLADAMIGGSAAVWVNLPARSDDASPQSRADEERAGLLDAYLVRISPDELLDWGTDEAGRWRWVLFCQIVSDRSTPDAERSRVWRWTAIDDTNIRRWEWRPREGRPVPEPEDEADELPIIPHKCGRLPIIPLTLPWALYAMARLADPAIELLRARGDLSWALYRSANPLLVITTASQGEVPRLGAGYSLTLYRNPPGTGPGEDKAEWIAPPGTSYEVLAQEIERRKEDLYRVLQQMALAISNDSSRVRASGESKKADWNAADVLLSAYAEALRGPMLDALRLVVRLRSGPAAAEAVQTAGLSGWQQLTLDELLAGAAQATDANRMSPTFRKAIAKRQAEALLPDAGEALLKTIRDEIDQAPVPPADPSPPAPRPAPTT